MTDGSGGHRVVLLPAPSTNRVYGAAAAALVRAEAQILLPGLADDAASTVTLGGVEHVELTTDEPLSVEALAGLSSVWLAHRRVGELLEPLDVPWPDLFDDDLITIPKYRGKTNEQFTRLLVSVALAALPERPADRRIEVLDPLCGRGTTLSCAWLRGADAYGIDADVTSLEAYAAFLTTYLRRKRLKHTVEVTPFRRDGRSLGKRVQATVRLPDRAPLHAGLLTGDARDADALWGKRRFDAVITDAPYGVVHGSERRPGKGPGKGPGQGATAGRRDRSAADLLTEAVPVWAGRLRPGGVLAVAWNTLNLSRDDLLATMAGVGLTPYDEGAWRRLAHQVDSSIHRDVAVAVAPR